MAGTSYQHMGKAEMKSSVSISADTQPQYIFLNLCFDFIYHIANIE